MLWQRYDEMAPNPVAGARQVAAFLDAPLDDAAIRHIGEECSTDSAKKRCDDAGKRVIEEFHAIRLQDPAAAQEWLRQIQRGERIMQDQQFLLPHNHISKSKGASGQWKTALSTSELASIMDQYESWVSDAGYAL